jgi:hypothetical protein
LSVSVWLGEPPQPASAALMTRTSATARRTPTLLLLLLGCVLARHNGVVGPEQGLARLL